MIIRRKLRLEQCKVCRRPFKRALIIDLVTTGFRMQTTSIALLQRWYSHIREKRPTRQDFLKSLVKIFQENPSYESSQDDVNYTRYMAENFAAFDYKTQEEVLTVIKYLTNVLSTTGMQLLEIVSPSHLLTHLHAPSQSQQQPSLSQSQPQSQSQTESAPSADISELPHVRRQCLICISNSNVFLSDR